MQVKSRTYSAHTLTLDDDSEVGLEYKPCDQDDILAERVGDKLVVAYLVHDDDCDNPLENCDGMGKVVGRGKYETRRHSESDLFEALGLDRNGDPDFGSVDDEVNALWEARIKLMDADEWSQLVDELGLVVEKTDEAIAWASDVITRLKRRLLDQDVTAEGSTYYTLTNVVEEMDEFDSTRTQITQATSTICFDVEAVQLEEWRKAVAAGTIGDRDAVMLDVYDHSLLHWSLSGGGMNCQWDTSRGAGVWLPDTCAREEIDRRAPIYAHYLVRKTPIFLKGGGKEYQLLSQNGKLEHVEFGSQSHLLFEKAQTLALGLETTPEMLVRGRRYAAEELAQQALDQYNAWLSGDVYGCVSEIFQLTNPDSDPGDFEWEQIEQDACWGHVGHDWAMQSLRDEFYDRHIADLKAEALT